MSPKPRKPAAKKKPAGTSPIRVVDGAAYHAYKDDLDVGVAYHSSIPVGDIEPYCVSLARANDGVTGYQRGLDMRRAQEIADYLDSGMPIPGEIALAAQRGAALEWNRNSKTVGYKRLADSFAVIDGQHRLAGFALAKTKRRVNVVIYEGLDRAMEARIFIDVNDRSKGVPPALMADVRALAKVENDVDARLRALYDELATDPRSPLHGLTSPAGAEKGKLTRVTFNGAYRWIFAGSDTNLGDFAKKKPDAVPPVLASYLRAWSAALVKPELLVKPAVFGALAMVMEDVLATAQRVHRRTTEPALRDVAATHVDALNPGEGTRLTKSGMVEALRASLRGKVGLVETDDEITEDATGTGGE